MAKIRTAPLIITFKKGEPPALEALETVIRRALRPYPIEFLGLVAPCSLLFKFKRDRDAGHRRGETAGDAVVRSVRGLLSHHLSGVQIAWGWRDDVPQEIRSDS